MYIVHFILAACFFIMAVFSLRDLNKLMKLDRTAREKIKKIKNMGWMMRDFTVEELDKISRLPADDIKFVNSIKDNYTAVNTLKEKIKGNPGGEFPQ